MADSESGLVFTGERFVPHQTDPLLALEHYHRYHFASRLAHRKRVIDIACGEGYGSAFLSRFAQSVVGIDINAETIDHARRKYAGCPNLRFEVGGCEEFSEQPFDMAVSFELLEHLDSGSQGRFLENVRRILKPDGLFLVSSPEKLEYAATYQSANEYHKNELTLQELKHFLEKYFKHVHLCAQRVLSMSAIWRLENWKEPQFRVDAKKNLLEDLPTGGHFPTPLYVVALCSDSPIPESALAGSNSLYLDAANSDQTRDFARWAQRLNDEAVQSRAILADLQKRLEERTAWAFKLDGRIKEQNDMVETLQNELDNRTNWARSLESDVAKAREYAGTIENELHVVSDELFQIRKKMSLSYLYRILTKLKLLPSVGKEDDASQSSSL